MKFKSTVAFAAILLSVLFTSCEGNTDYEWKVENKSSTAIEVISHITFLDVSANKTIEVNDITTITVSDQLGGNSTEQEPSNTFSIFKIVNANGDTLIKDYRLSANWDANIEHLKKVPSNYKHDYTFTVVDSDFN